MYTVYDDLLKNVKVTDTSNLFNETDYDAKIKDIIDKITSRLWCKNIRNWVKIILLLLFIINLWLIYLRQRKKKKSSLTNPIFVNL